MYVRTYISYSVVIDHVLLLVGVRLGLQKQGSVHTAHQYKTTSTSKSMGGSRGLWGPPEIYHGSQKNDVLV